MKGAGQLFAKLYLPVFCIKEKRKLRIVPTTICLTSKTLKKLMYVLDDTLFKIFEVYSKLQAHNTLYPLFTVGRLGYPFQFYIVLRFYLN